MRSIATAILNGLSAETVRRIYLVRLHFDSATIGWNTGFRDIVFDGVTYLGLGQLTSIAAAKETPGLKSGSITVGLSGIKEEMVSLLLSEPYLNRPAYIHYTLLDEHDVQLTGDPVLYFAGTMNNVTGEMGKSAGFSVEIKSRLADWERKRSHRYTDAEQQKLYPGDIGFEYVGQMEQAKIVWPKAGFFPDQRD